MKFTFFLFLNIICTISYAQIYDAWFEAKVELTTGKVLRGTVNLYNAKNEDFSIKINDNLNVIQPEEFVYLSYFDTINKKQRTYYSLKLPRSSKYKRFELLVESEKTSLLASETFVEYKPKHFNQSLFEHYINKKQRLVNKTQLYAIINGGELIPVNTYRIDKNWRYNRMNLKAICSNDQELALLEKYIDLEKLDKTNKEDITKIITYYNSLTPLN